MKPKYTCFRDIPQFTRDAAYKVNVPWDYLERHLERLSDGTTLELDPDFQRAHVWDEVRQSRYVEYVLRGGRAAREIYWNCSSWMDGFNSPIQLVDGKQRLEAVRKFMRNELIIFGNTRFSDFTDTLRMTGPDFIFYVNNLQKRAEVLQWYLDLNTGGVVHTDEEIEKVQRLLEQEHEATTPAPSKPGQRTDL